jgi:hypothetical protein
MCYFKKSKNKNKAKKGNKGNRGGGGNGNSRQRRKARRESISEAQRLAIVNAVLSKKRLLIYADSL